MVYIRHKKFSGGRVYYYRVAGHREGKKVRQKVVEYLGKSPNRRKIPVEPSVAAPIAQAIISGKTTPQEMKELLNRLGIEFTGRLKRVSLDYNPPLRKLTLHIE